jgi:hypothetical protein
VLGVMIVGVVVKVRVMAAVVMVMVVKGTLVSHGGNQSHKRKGQAGPDDKCHNCSGIGHWKGEYPSAKKKKTQGGGSNANGANPAFRRFQTKTNDNDDDHDNDVMALFVCDSPFDKRKCEWILDTGSKVHLCVNGDLLTDLDRSRGLHFTA